MFIVGYHYNFYNLFMYDNYCNIISCMLFDLYLCVFMFIAYVCLLRICIVSTVTCYLDLEIHSYVYFEFVFLFHISLCLYYYLVFVFCFCLYHLYLYMYVCLFVL